MKPAGLIKTKIQLRLSLRKRNPQLCTQWCMKNITREAKAELIRMKE